MEEKILEVMRDKSVRYTMYSTTNIPGTRFFEGTDKDGNKALKQAKIWAKERGYTHLVNVSVTLGKEDKTYTL